MTQSTPPMPDVVALLARVKELEEQANAAKALPAVHTVSPSEGDLDASPDLTTFLSPHRPALAVVENNNAIEEEDEKPADLGSLDIDSRWEKYDKPLVAKSQANFKFGEFKKKGLELSKRQLEEFRWRSDCNQACRESVKEVVTRFAVYSGDTLSLAAYKFDLEDLLKSGPVTQSSASSREKNKIIKAYDKHNRQQEPDLRHDKKKWADLVSTAKQSSAALGNKYLGLKSVVKGGKQVVIKRSHSMVDRTDLQSYYKEYIQSVHGAIPLVFREKVGTLISSARTLKHKSSSGGPQVQLENSSLPAIKMISLESEALDNFSSDLQVAEFDGDGGSDGGNEQFATKALLQPKKLRKQTDGKTQTVIVGGKTVKPPKIGTMVDIEIQSKAGPMQWYTGRITAMVETTEDPTKSVYKIGFVDTEKLCFNLVDHFLAREYPALYPIPNWAPGGTKTTKPDDSPARTGTRDRRALKRSAADSKKPAKKSKKAARKQKIDSDDEEDEEV
jgi:hypothetical protein